MMRRYFRHRNSPKNFRSHSTFSSLASIHSRKKIGNFLLRRYAESWTVYGIDAARPILTQISRFDRLKDPVGVIARLSYRQTLFRLPTGSGRRPGR